MLVVETMGRIRREHLVKGKSIKEIARDLKISRNTVRKILRSGETSFSYEREVQPLPRLGRWKADLDRLLTANAGTSARERLTLIRLFEELRLLGYDGGYDAVRRYARTWSREHASQTAAAFVPLSFAPGEAYQFDWSHEIVLVSGVTVTVKVAHIRLCHSRMMFCRAYPRETQEMVFDAHERAFAFFRGACTRGIYDNRPRWRRSSLARTASIIGASCKCAVTIWLIRWPARPRQDGRRDRSRIRSVSSGNVFSRRAFGSKPTMS
jgi:transposase